MVDINLFKDDEDEKDWKPTPGEGEELEGNRQEDLEFEEDVWETPALGDEDILGDEETIPDFEEPGEIEEEEDYEFGDVKKKKTSVWLWFLMGIVLVCASLYLFVLQPRQIGIKRLTTYVTKKPSEAGKRVEEIQERGLDRDAALVDSSGVDRSGQVAAMVDSDYSRAMGSVSTAVEASRAVFEDLTRHGQFGAVLLTGDRFFVEYVSETPGVAKAMGHRIQTLLGASGFKVSPEERHRTAGRIHYWGVVSGELPQKARGAARTPVQRFATAESFIEGIKGFVLQHRLTVRGLQKLSESSEEGTRQTCIRVKVEGSKTHALDFLESLKGFQGNYGLAKLLLVPSNYSDFKANQVKLVLDFLVSVG